MSSHDSDMDSMLFSASDEEPVSLDSVLRTPEEAHSDQLGDDQLASDFEYDHHQQLSG